MVSLRIISLGLLAAVGCATMDGRHALRVEETVVDSLYGTWHWISEEHGSTQGQLILNPDATYVLSEHNRGGGSSMPGRFKVYRIADQDSFDSWLELETGGIRRERVFQFAGRDTLLLRDGVSGYAVTDSEVDLFVRAPIGKPAWTTAWGAAPWA